MQKLTPATLDALEAALAKYGDHRPLDIKDRHPALIADARLTLPELIGEKHRDGNYWLVFDVELKTWVKCRWYGDLYWLTYGGGRLQDPPPLALPMPEAPEGTDA